MQHLTKDNPIPRIDFGPLPVRRLWRSLRRPRDRSRGGPVRLGH